MTDLHRKYLAADAAYANATRELHTAIEKERALVLAGKTTFLFQIALEDCDALKVAAEAARKAWIGETESDRARRESQFGKAA